MGIAFGVCIVLAIAGGGALEYFFRPVDRVVSWLRDHRFV
jgi:hypothetical protein